MVQPPDAVQPEAVIERLWHLKAGDEAAFEALAAEVLAYQRAHNPVYRRFARTHTYLPIAAFKHGPVTAFPPHEAERVFESSGTGRGTPSRHYVRSTAVYERSITTHFEAVFGPGPFTLVAHLPHYTERGATSSLLFMVDVLIRRFGGPYSGQFLEDTAPLEAAIDHSMRSGTPLILFGAAFGLLDLVERKAFRLGAAARVVETGGMKTYRRAVDRSTLHSALAAGFGVARRQVWSEYGMCELLSQCYTRGGPVFYAPPWMRCRVVDPEDPTRTQPEGQPGVLAVLDLANLYAASALLTEDRAVQRGDGFEVLGRLSQAELRGCNFLIEPDRT